MFSLWRIKILNFLQIPIKLKFPRVKSLTTQELDLWLKDPEKSNPLLLDARSSEEYALSHLQGAESVRSVQDFCRDVKFHVSTKNFGETDNSILEEKIPFDTPIVVYCSIGYRSADVANSLVKAGYSCVFNLSGGIFQWVNEERPVFRKIQLQDTQFQNTQLVRSVHPYNKLWGKLIEPEYRNSAVK